MERRVKGPWLVAGLIIATALAARVAYCWGLSPYDRRALVFDVDHYDPLARSLLHSGRFDVGGAPTATREPLYPLILAGAYAVGGEGYDTVWALHCLLGAGTVAVVFVLGRLLFGDLVALLAAALSAIYPQFLYYTAHPSRETLQTLLLPGAVLASARLSRAPSRVRLTAAGALWAALPLTNSVFLPLAFLAGPLVWVVGRRLGRDVRGWSAALFLLIAALYSPWPLRNALVFRRFVPGIDAGGPHLYTSFVVPNDFSGTSEEAHFLLGDPVMRAAQAFPPVERDRFLYAAAVRWIVAHPFGFLRVMGASLLKMWRLYPYPRQYPVNYKAVRLVALASDGWMIPLGFIGLILAGRRRPEGDLVLAAMFVVTGVYVVFWATIRYRLPLMPFVHIYGAYAAIRLSRKSIGVPLLALSEDSASSPPV